MPSAEENETGFSVLTTFELNLKLPKDGPPAFSFLDCAISHKSRATRYSTVRAMSYKLRETRRDLQAKIYKI
jgi:hypothetical protein